MKKPGKQRPSGSFRKWRSLVTDGLIKTDT